MRRYKQQLKILMTSVPLCAAFLTTAYPGPADRLLGQKSIFQISGSTLQKLECELEDFKFLLHYPNLKELTFLAPDRVHTFPAPEDTWVLSQEQAECLAQLPLLTSLSFFGFTSVELSSVSMPNLKVITSHILMHVVKHILYCFDQCIAFLITSR